MESSIPWNISLFHLINGPAHPSPVLLSMAEGLAIFPPWLAVALLAIAWLYGGIDKRRAAMIAGFSLLLGLAINFLIGALYYTPRPFELGIGNNLYPHGLETSFPSDHATVLWSLGFSLFATRALRPLGLLFCLLGLCTAWARVFLGVHFPFDMAGSAVVSVIAAAISYRLSWLTDLPLFRSVEHIHGWLRRYLPGSR